MICCFCSNRMRVYTHHFHLTLACVHKGCVVDDMSRYEITYNNYPTYLLSRNIILNNFYIQIDYRNNKTIISRLAACFLVDSIEIPKALSLDTKNPYDLLTKIKTLMVFS